MILVGMGGDDQVELPVRFGPDIRDRVCDRAEVALAVHAAVDQHMPLGLAWEGQQEAIAEAYTIHADADRRRLGSSGGGGGGVAGHSQHPRWMAAKPGPLLDGPVNALPADASVRNVRCRSMRSGLSSGFSIHSGLPPSG